MHESTFSNPNWYLGLGLSERARCARPPGSLVSSSNPATSRFEKWKAQRPFTGGGWLQKRLASEGLDVPSLYQALSLSADELKARASRPEWLTKLEASFAQATIVDVTGRTFALASEDHSTSALLNLVAPVLESARTRLRAALAPLAGGPFDVEYVASLFMATLAQRVLYTIERPLVLELHIAKLEGWLSGATPEARFEHFAHALAERDRALATLAQYPVLARRVVEMVEDALVAATEFTTRLAQDWPAIRDTFFDGDDPGGLVEINAHAGDPHRHGRRVIIAKFESGARLVYKPRSLEVDVHFQELLAFLNQRLDAPPFHTMAVLPRPGYGWLEFIEPRPCTSHAEARRFYWRVGGLLAVLHSLRGVDCHFENVIAHGDQPVLVDLETVFHPLVRTKDPERTDRRFAAHVLARSLLRVGLMPVPMGGDDALAGVDLSGVASVEGAMSPDRVLQWEKVGTDEMHAVRASVEMSGADNRASLDGRPLDVVEFRGDVEGGFTDVYRLIMRERESLLAPVGPVEKFAHDEVRAVIRATRAYGMLLGESLHPDLLRDAVERDRFFDRVWVGVEELPILSRVAGAEHRDLSRGDVPYFASRPDSRDLWTSEGECLPDFFERCALDLVRERIRAMDEAELVRQRWLITLSLGSLAAVDEGKRAGAARPVVHRKSSALEDQALHSELLNAASRIGERLAGIATWDGDDVAWVALEFREQRWLLAPLSQDLYVGSPGVALFLGYLEHVLHGQGLPRASQYGDLARAAVRTLLRTTADSDLTSIGAFSGWGGVLYSLSHLSTLWRDEELRHACTPVIERIDAFAERDEDADIIGGLAGAIGALCAAHAARVSDSALTVAARCGDLLLARARATESGIWWRTRLAGDSPSTGFSHGNAGIAWSLLTLADATREPRFLRAGLAATAFEREHLRAVRETSLNTPVHPSAPRDSESSLTAMWCYGAPGIGISRLRALRSAQSGAGPHAGLVVALRAEIEETLNTTLANGFGLNHCLCHGDLGNLDFLKLVADALPDLRDADGELPADRIRCEARALVDAGHEREWLCGTPSHVPSPGLMNGLSGIGYGLLRLADAARVPSVLALEPPRME